MLMDGIMFYLRVFEPYMVRRRRRRGVGEVFITTTGKEGMVFAERHVAPFLVIEHLYLQWPAGALQGHCDRRGKSEEKARKNGGKEEWKRHSSIRNLVRARLGVLVT